MSTTLYACTDALAAVYAMLDESEGEWTPAIEAAMLEAEGNFNEKVERVALFIRDRLANAAAVTTEVDRLKSRATALTRTADSLKAYLAAELTRAGKDKVTGVLATVALQNNPAALQVDETQWDDCAVRGLAQAYPEAVTHTPESYRVNKRWVTDAVKAGTLEIPVGMMITVGKSLRIR